MDEVLTVEKVIEAETERLERRRAEGANAGKEYLAGGYFGIALSGGGIRSATLAAGFLEVLNRAGLLRAADYVSSVSGGGYIGSYVQAAIYARRGDRDPFEKLFCPGDLAGLLKYRHYLAPGAGLRARLRLVRFAAAFLATLLLNLAWLAVLLVAIGSILWVPWSLAAGADFWSSLSIVPVAVLGWHFFGHWLRRFGLWSAAVLNWIETFLLIGAAVIATQRVAQWASGVPAWLARVGESELGLGFLPNDLSQMSPGRMFFSSLIVLLFVGLFADPNRLTMHAFYRARLAAAYLGVVDRGLRRVRLRDLACNGQWTVGPYPLVNGCVDLLRDTSLKGARASDYFLFSPLHCGSRLVGYRPTSAGQYPHLELATAMTASGAAVNPSMGTGTSPVLAFLMSVLNLRLGYWVTHRARSRFVPTWWPRYLLGEAFQRAAGDRAVLSVADGGFIENLGVFELLRRRCRVVIALDGTSDPDYEFGDLRNLVVRARQELGIQIEFLQAPEEMIRPSPSVGFSRSHFVIAKVTGLPKGPAETYSGWLIYAKSSLRPQKRWRDLGQDSSAGYKTYHARFPHESTGDQFFDEPQWMAYFDLGRFIAGDLLGIDVRRGEAWQRQSPDDLVKTVAGLASVESLEKYLMIPEQVQPATTKRN